MLDKILEVKNLTKKFGNFTAVDKISFYIKRGEVVGFLGPNGAGKTTTIHMLLGITLLNGGTIKYFGKDFSTNRQASLQRINFSSSFNTLQGRISVWENLMVFAYLYGLKNPKKKISEVAEYFEINDLFSKRFWDLSSGQKTRVNLAKSLLNDPEIILMDEPTASLDPDIADKTLSLIEALRKSRKISLLYTSHDMNEVARVCDRVVFLDRGKIVAEDTPLGLTKTIKAAELTITFDGNKNRLEKFLKDQNQKYTFIKNFIVNIETEEKLIPGIIFKIGKEDIWITDISVKKASLEDVFIQIARGRNNVN